MVLDIFSAGISSILLISGLISIVQSYRLYMRIGTRFYRYATEFSICISLWVIHSLSTAILNDPSYYDTVIGIHYLFRPFGFIAIGLMVAAMESVKGDSRSMLTNIAFVFAGGLAVGLVSPTSFAVEWLDNYWISRFSYQFEVGRLILFSTIVISAVPLGRRIYKRLAPVIREDKIVRSGFWLALLLSWLILLVQPLSSFFPEILMPLVGQSLFILLITLFLVLLTLLLHRHPTILFIEAHRISEMYIIMQDSGLPLYHYKFDRSRTGGSEVISAFFTGIKDFVKLTLEKGGIERILVGEQELTIQEGIHIYGILIAKESSELTTNLLRISVDAFEKHYQFDGMDHVKPTKMKEFNDVIKRYFEFALIPEN